MLRRKNHLALARDGGAALPALHPPERSGSRNFISALPAALHADAGSHQSRVSSYLISYRGVCMGLKEQGDESLVFHFAGVV